MKNKKDCRLSFRLTHHEIAHLQTQAAAQSTTLSQLLRGLIQAYMRTRKVLL